MITHHLNDRLLMAYSAGSLPEAFNLVVATHVSVCDDCRARLASFDAVGGALLEEDSAVMASDSLATVMARIKSGAPTAKPDGRPRDAVLPVPLVDAIGGGLDRVQWRAVGGGVRQAILQTSDKASARLLHIPAGAAVPDHGHQGMELTLVLQGAFRDEDAIFQRGDVEIATEEMEHTPIAEPGQD
ncbi:MAG: transcriptional regulator, partial [Alphaproteobacteria bacterium]|nr:transcriptional regulator [Alphaproteobacteria bacterium]